MAEAREVVLAQLREQGPTVSLARARALVFEAAAGRLSADEAAPVAGADGVPQGRRAAGARRRPGHLARDPPARAARDRRRRLGRRGSEDAGGGGRSARAGGRARGRGGGARRRQARWTASSATRSSCSTGGSGWACLTGRAGTGKGPTLHAAAEAYRAAGWRVDRVRDGRHHRPADGRATRRARAGADRRAAQGPPRRPARSQLDESHRDLRRRGLKARHRPLGRARQRRRAPRRQPCARSATTGSTTRSASPACSPRCSPTSGSRPRSCARSAGTATPATPAELHPWLRDYQIAVDQGRGVDAVAILQAARRAQALRHPRAGDGRDGRGVGPVAARLRAG